MTRVVNEDLCMVNVFIFEFRMLYDCASIAQLARATAL
jgi:hypothetical protein